MSRNRISELRKARKLTQHELAAKVGTSQQQIQRIEAGARTVRLEQAVKIAKALGVALSDLFPNLPRLPTKIAKRESRGRPARKSAHEAFADAGIDPDPRHWTLKLGLCDGRVLEYTVSSQDKDRISSIVQKALFRFVIFDSDDKRIAIKREGINFYQFLFDVGVVEAESEEESSWQLQAFFVRGGDYSFGVEPDTLSMESDDYGSASQLQRVFFFLESDPDDDDILSFDDEDAERIYLPVRQLLRIELPLACCEPSLWENILEESIGEQEASPKDTNMGSSS